MQTRREFLTALGTALGTGACARAHAQLMPGVAHRTHGRRGRFFPGLQLYTVRTLLARDFDGTLEAVARIGYRDVEFAGYFGRTAAAVQASLVQHGLTAPSSHVALPQDAAAWARTLDDARTAGHEWVVVPWVDASLRRTPDDWRRLAERMNRLGARAQGAGLRFAYHNRDVELVRSGDSTPFDVLLAQTDPALVSFEMDVYWLAKAGADPLAYLAGHAGRFPMLHLADATAAPERRMVDVGKGTIDFAAVLRRAREDGARYAFVKHDEPANPLASARASYHGVERLSY